MSSKLFNRLSNMNLNLKTLAIISICVLLIVVVGLPAGNVQAQGILSNGVILKGSITDQTRILVYSYVATAGDLIDAHVIGTSPGMNPNLSLLSPSQQQLATNDNDPFSTLDGTDSRISYLVQEPGVYSYLVSGTNGDFLLRFTVRKAGNGTPLKLNTPVEVTLQASATNAYSFAADPANPQNLSIASTSAGFAFSAQIYDPAGQLVAVLGSPSVLSASVIIAPAGRNSPSKGNYQVYISPLFPNTQGSVSILIGAAQPIAPSTDGTANTNPNPTAVQPTVQPTAVPPTNTPTPVVTPTNTPIPVNPLAPAGVCSGTPLSKVVNIRSGPGTNYPVLGPLQPGVFLVLQGRSVDGQWYVNTDNNKQSWVSLQVVALSGPCEQVPIVPAPPLPPTNTPTPSNTPPVIGASATPTAKILVQPKSTAAPTLPPSPTTAG